jgi:hypothetical protein
MWVFIFIGKFDLEVITLLELSITFCVYDRANLSYSSLHNELYEKRIIISKLKNKGHQ